MSDTVTSWTLRIGSKAFKEVFPEELRVYPEVVTHKSGMLWWKRAHTEVTGRWIIAFRFRRNFLGTYETDYISFDNEKDAQAWYDTTFTGVFLGKSNVTPPPPSKKKSDLHLV